MRRWLLILWVVAAAMAVGAADVTDASLRGKADGELKRAVGALFRPPRLIVRGALEREVTRLWGDPTGSCAACLAPVKWWEFARQYGDTVGSNLYNNILMPVAVELQRDTWPVGNITGKVVVEANGWAMGHAELYGVTTGFVEPPDHLKGDVARMLFYMVTLYPSSLWGGKAVSMLEDNDYPSLTAHGQGTYIRWHHADPVDEAERARNVSIAMLQGGVSNPFVDYPSLADYLWGAYRGKPYGGEVQRPDEGQSGGEEEPEDNRPLRSVYRSGDGRVNLFHPAVPAGAQWSVDGRAVKEPWIAVESMGRGVHQLEFAAPGGVKGMVKIEIR